MVAVPGEQSEVSAGFEGEMAVGAFVMYCLKRTFADGPASTLRCGSRLATTSSSISRRSEASTANR